MTQLFKYNGRMLNIDTIRRLKAKAGEIPNETENKGNETENKGNETENKGNETDGTNETGSKDTIDIELSELQSIYTEVTGKNLGNAYKNNKEWMLDKINKAKK